MSERARFKSLHTRLETLVRAGNVRQAHTLLNEMNTKKIPREQAADFANLARRTGMARWALKTLWPLVNGSTATAPSPRDWVEYGCALTKTGAYAEATDILTSTKVRGSLEAPLYLAFIQISQWNYTGAIPHLKTYLKSSSLSDHGRLLASLNLAASYVFTSSFAHAREILHEMRDRVGTQAWPQAHVAIMEMLSIIFIYESNFTEAHSQLDLALAAAKDSSISAVSLLKWRAIADLVSLGPQPQALDAMAAVRDMAVHENHYETVRDCDYYRGLALNDRTSLLRVYFGTPFKAYRQRLENAAGASLAIPNQFVWQSGHKSAALDLSSGYYGEREAFKRDAGSLRVLQALASDMYRPTSTGALHAQLFPREFFNPESSWSRVYRAVERTRKHLIREKLNMTVLLKNGQFQLSPGEISLILPLAPRESTATNFDTKLDTLKKAWPYKAFTSRQAAQALNLAPESVRKILSLAVVENRLLKLGSGRGTQFRFVA
jgi:hypothetical protein